MPAASSPAIAPSSARPPRAPSCSHTRREPPGQPGSCGGGAREPESDAGGSFSAGGPASGCGARLGRPRAGARRARRGTGRTRDRYSARPRRAALGRLMRALVISPGEARSTRVADVAEVSARNGEVPVRPLEVGVCGTDREMSEGLFGIAPEGDDFLVLGHEFVGVVERDGHGFARGDLVTAIVRRSCGHCLACGEGAPDSCLTGDYSERGITRLLARRGVLGEPASICERAPRHARSIGGRQPWELQRALVIGTGAIGMLSTYLLRLAGLEVWTAALDSADDPRADLVTASGARYVSTPVEPLAALVEDVGGFDLVIEAAGNAELMAAMLGMLRRSGVACLIGIDPRVQRVELDGRVIGVDTVLGNRVLFGSVNANRVDWLAAVSSLDRARKRWPDVLPQFVGLRVPLDRFEDAFDYRGVKATLVLQE